VSVKSTELFHVSADSETCYNYYSNVQNASFRNVTPWNLINIHRRFGEQLNQLTTLHGVTYNTKIVTNVTHSYDIQSYTSLNSVSDIRNNLSISSPVRNFRNRLCCLDFLRNITAIYEYIEGEIKQQNGETWTTELRNLCTYILLESPNRKRLVRNSDGTRILGGPTHKWEHIIKMELNIQGCRLDSSELCSTR